MAHKQFTGGPAIPRRNRVRRREVLIVEAALLGSRSNHVFHSLFCHKPLGSNDVLESFPIGQRLAFDGAKGRFWVATWGCSFRTDAAIWSWSATRRARP